MIPCNENIGSSQTTSGLSLFPFVGRSTDSEECLYLKRWGKGALASDSRRFVSIATSSCPQIAKRFFSKCFFFNMPIRRDLFHILPSYISHFIYECRQWPTKLIFVTPQMVCIVCTLHFWSYWNRAWEKFLGTPYISHCSTLWLIRKGSCS